LRALSRLPLLSIGATAAALLCAGGAALVGPGGSGSGSPAGPAPAPDHYLCVPGLGPDCRSVAVTLPDGATAAVGDPDARLRCEHQWSWHRFRHHHADGETVEVVNELSPPGADGPMPVALVEKRLRWTCALETSPTETSFRSGRRSPRAVAPTTLARFACFTVEYPTRDGVRFTTPSGVLVGDRFRVDVRHPAVLCLPSDPAAATGGANVLVCFDTRVRGRWWGPLLCVPSSTDSTPVGTPAPTTGPAGTASTTTSTTPTTSGPPDSSTTTTTGSPTTSSTTTPPTTTTTTTTTTPTSQPCPGVVIDGICVIDL
jgi:hypothetical protein